MFTTYLKFKTVKKNKLFTLCFAVFAISLVNAYGQSVGISTAPIIPDASSILEIRTTTKGFLGPRMTALERLAITSPATGLLVYDTDSSALMLYNGSSWKALMLTGTTTGGSGTAAGFAFKAVAGAVTNGSSAYNAFLKLPFMNINTLGYNVGGGLSNDGKAIFTVPAGGGIFHFEVRLHFSTDASCTTNYAIRFLRNGSVATDAQKSGILHFTEGFNIQEAYCSKDYLLNSGDTIEVEYFIGVPSPVPGSFWMVGSLANITSSFSGNRTVAF